MSQLESTSHLWRLQLRNAQMWTSLVISTRISQAIQRILLSAIQQIQLSFLFLSLNLSFNLILNDIANSVDWNPAKEEDYDVEKDDGESRMLDNILQKSWAECRPQVDEDKSDEEGDSSESDDGRESGSEWGGEGIYNGLGRDDLIEEGLQRLIAEFGAHICFSWFDTIL